MRSAIVISSEAVLGREALELGQARHACRRR